MDKKIENYMETGVHSLGYAGQPDFQKVIMSSTRS